MPQFFYTAKSIDGKEKQGVIDAQDEREIAHVLHQEGYVLTKIEEQHIRNSRRLFEFFMGVSLKEKIFFCRNLQVMMNSGVSLPRALGILEVQAKNKNFRKALEKIKSEITKGIAFSDALGLYPAIFSDFFRSMVKVGEETGTMENVLAISVSQMEKEYELNSKIRGAMIYPTVILIAMLGVGALMLITIVPQLAATFKEMGTELPPTTQFIIAAGDFLKKQWIIALGIIFISIFAFFRLIKTVPGKRVFTK